MIVSKTYQTITEESAVNGSFEDDGFIFKDEEMTVEETVQLIESIGTFEWSELQINENSYLTTIESECNRDYYEKGIETYYSLHFKYKDHFEFLWFINELKERSFN